MLPVSEIGFCLISDLHNLPLPLTHCSNGNLGSSCGEKTDSVVQMLPHLPATAPADLAEQLGLYPECGAAEI